MTFNNSAKNSYLHRHHCSFPLIQGTAGQVDECYENVAAVVERRIVVEQRCSAGRFGNGLECCSKPSLMLYGRVLKGNCSIRLRRVTANRQPYSFLIEMQLMMEE